MRDKAAALEIYCRQARNLDAERKAANVRLRAERRAGELLGEMARAQGARSDLSPTLSNDATKSQSTDEVVASFLRDEQVLPSEFAQALRSTGISRQTAHRYQALANVPVAVVEDALAAHGWISLKVDSRLSTALQSRTLSQTCDGG